MSESTQTEKPQNASQRINEFLEEVNDVKGLYEQLALAEVVDKEQKRREHLRSKAKRLLEEYENMSEEEQEEFEEQRNKDGNYSKEQLEEIANMDEVLDQDKLEELNVPPRYVSSDIQGRSTSEVRTIMTTLMGNYDPVAKEAPNWSQTKKDLKKEDISIAVSTLKRYWSAIEEKEAFNLVKEKMYWEIIDNLKDASDALVQHVIDRVDTEGGDYDKIHERVDALVKVLEQFKNMPENKPQRVQVDKREAQKKEYVFKEMDDDEIESIEEDGVIDVEGE